MQQINHRHITPASEKRLATLVNRYGIVERVRKLIPADLVGDVVSVMRAEERNIKARLSAVDPDDHKRRQYVMCSECGEMITLADFNANECFSCGEPIVESKKG